MTPWSRIITPVAPLTSLLGEAHNFGIHTAWSFFRSSCRAQSNATHAFIWISWIGSYMLKKLLALLFTTVLVSSLSMPVFAQEGSKKEEAKETPAPEKAEKKAA